MRDKSRSGEQTGNVSTTLHAKLWPRMPVGRASCSLGHLEPFLFSCLNLRGRAKRCRNTGSIGRSNELAQAWQECTMLVRQRRKYKKCHLEMDVAAEAQRNAAPVARRRDIFEIRESVLALSKSALG